MTVSFQATQKFDDQQYRHYVNNELSVLHCHHYSTLFTQLADDAQELNGPELLRNSFAETIYPVLAKYYQENNVSQLDDKIAIAEQYCVFMGLGKIKIDIQGESGSAELLRSHIDEGWIAKWGKNDKPINFIGQGFIAAVFAAITGKSVEAYQVSEIKSIVCGEKTSQFSVQKK
jgi:hypothetical protein